jgi:hypothetical protein
MTTEAHHQIIDDFIQKSTVTDDRPKEEREKINNYIAMP